LCFINLIVYWYRDMQCCVKWNNCFSSWFQVLAGVRQGGVLSPIFYCLYVDELISELIHSGIGCYLRDMFLSCLMYADDMALVAPSMSALRKLLEICGHYCVKWDIKLNPKKSKLMSFGKATGTIAPVSLNGVVLDFVDVWSYLGIDVCSGPVFSCSITDKIKSFYGSLNGILRIEGSCNELVLLRLAEAHCVPILTYGIEIVHVSDPNERRQLQVAYNSLFRRIFCMRKFDSVTELQLLLGRKTWEQLLKCRTDSFNGNLSKSSNPIFDAFTVV
jgi:hypothetical protein